MDMTRTTVSIPTQLLERLDRMIRSGEVKSRREFFGAAIDRELAYYQRKAIDREFEAMGADPLYCREARTLCREYEGSDWEAMGLAEEES